MVNRYLWIKFGITPVDVFWENAFYTWTNDDRQTTTDDERTMTVALLCSSTKQSYKNKKRRKLITRKMIHLAPILKKQTFITIKELIKKEIKQVIGR